MIYYAQKTQKLLGFVINLVKLTFKCILYVNPLQINLFQLTFDIRVYLDYLFNFKISITYIRTQVQNTQKSLKKIDSLNKFQVSPNNKLSTIQSSKASSDQMGNLTCK